MPRRARRAPDDPGPATRVTLPPGTTVAVVLFALALLGTLAGQLVIVQQQRDIARQQRALAERQLRDLRPAIRDARPALRRLVPLAAQLRSARLPDTARDARALAEGLLEAGGPEALRQAGIAAGTLNDEARLERLVRSAITVLGGIRTTDLVDRAARASRAAIRLDRTQDEALRILRSALRLQREGVALARGTLTTARETLDVARRTEGHAASLDRKLGGELPAPPG